MMTRRKFLKSIFVSPIFADYVLNRVKLVEVAHNISSIYPTYTNCGVYPLSGKYSYLGCEIKKVIEFTNFLIKEEYPPIINFFGKNIKFDISTDILNDRSSEYIDTLIGAEIQNTDTLFVHGSYASNLTFHLKYACYLARLPLVNFISTASKLTSNTNEYFVRTCASNLKILKKLIYEFLPHNFEGNFALLHAPNLYGFDILFNMQELLKSTSLKRFFVFHQPVADYTNFYNSVSILKKKNVKNLILSIYLPSFKKLLNAFVDLDYYPTIITLTYFNKEFVTDYKDLLKSLKIYYVDHRGKYFKKSFEKINDIFISRTSLELDTNLARIFQGYLIALYPLIFKPKNRENYIKILKNIRIPKEKLFLDWDNIVFEHSENLGAKVEFKKWQV